MKMMKINADQGINMYQSDSIAIASLYSVIQWILNWWFIHPYVSGWRRCNRVSGRNPTARSIFHDINQKQFVVVVVVQGVVI